MPRGPRRPTFDDGADARADFRRGSRTNPRKTQQLCSQVGRAIDVALTGDDLDERLLDVRVQRVEPTADEGRLLVIFELDRSAATLAKPEALALLEAARPAILREVAASIHRRKVPDLAFELVLAPEVDA